jgi:glycosyltransferase involved in cell wall biosynthesis
MNLLLFNLAVDAEHVTLAFSIKWIELLARRFDNIDVVTMYAGRYSLPPNVTVWSVGRELGYPKWLRVLRFYWVVIRIIRQRRVDIAFTHMIHAFAVLFWPVARLTGIRNLLWYAHGAMPLGVRLAHWAADRVVSSTPEGFRLSSNKVSFIGQGIDMAEFKPGARQRGEYFRVVSVARLSAVKGIDILVDTLDRWCPQGYVGWHLLVVGAATSPEEKEYAEALQQRASTVIGGNIEWLGRLDSPDIARLLQSSDVFVNLSATGSLDKAIVEAMATGCPILSSNEAFRSIIAGCGLDMCIVPRSAEGLRDGLNRLAALDDIALLALSSRLAELAHRDHSLTGFIDRLQGELVNLSSASRI